MSLLLGIDIGTSACKAAVFSADGSVRAQSSTEYPVHFPYPGWAEQDPNDWWSAVCECLGEIRKQGVNVREIKGIGVDGQSWSVIPVDQKGNILAKTPIWFDTRAQSICEKLRNDMDEEEIFSLSGNELNPAYSSPKILWLKEQEPDVYHKAVKFLQSNSYIVYCLTGIFSQDKSQGYGLHCYDMRKQRWDNSMCTRMGIDMDKLPRIYDCHDIVGTVTEKAGAETGLPEGTPVVAGGLDAACGALGAGVINSGQTQEQGGQAGGMSICMDAYRPVKNLISSNHVVPGHWLLQGGTVGGGGVMRWIEREFGEKARQQAKHNGTSSMYELDRDSEAVAPGSDGVIFLPYMAGERSPIWDSQAKGVFYGLDYSKTNAHLVRASMEGVAYSLRHNLQTAEDAGVFVGELRAMGGAANSRLWTQIKADVTGKRIVVPSSDTATTLGSAMLAGVATGFYDSFKDAVVQTVSVRRLYQPREENSMMYRQAYHKYLALYQHLKHMMHE